MSEVALNLDRNDFCCRVCSDLPRQPVTLPCGHSFCLDCVQRLWDGEDRPACPQCRQTFPDRPPLCKNPMLEALVAQLNSILISPAETSVPREITCDVCPLDKLKAVKSCLTCKASYCDKHLQLHYNVPQFMQHRLVEPRDSLEEQEEESSSVQDEATTLQCSPPADQHKATGADGPLGASQPATSSTSSTIDTGNMFSSSNNSTSGGLVFETKSAFWDNKLFIATDADGPLGTSQPATSSTSSAIDTGNLYRDTSKGTSKGTGTGKGTSMDTGTCKGTGTGKGTSKGTSMGMGADIGTSKGKDTGTSKGRGVDTDTSKGTGADNSTSRSTGKGTGAGTSKSTGADTSKGTGADTSRSTGKGTGADTGTSKGTGADTGTSRSTGKGTGAGTSKGTGKGTGADTGTSRSTGKGTGKGTSKGTGADTGTSKGAGKGASKGAGTDTGTSGYGFYETKSASGENKLVFYGYGSSRGGLFSSTNATSSAFDGTGSFFGGSTFNSPQEKGVIFKYINMMDEMMEKCSSCESSTSSSSSATRIVSSSAANTSFSSGSNKTTLSTSTGTSSKSGQNQRGTISQTTTTTTTTQSTSLSFGNTSQAKASTVTNTTTNASAFGSGANKDGSGLLENKPATGGLGASGGAGDTDREVSSPEDDRARLEKELEERRQKIQMRVEQKEKELEELRRTAAGLCSSANAALKLNNHTLTEMTKLMTEKKKSVEQEIRSKNHISRFGIQYLLDYVKEDIAFWEQQKKEREIIIFKNRDPFDVFRKCGALPIIPPPEFARLVDPETTAFRKQGLKRPQIPFQVNSWCYFYHTRADDEDQPKFAREGFLKHWRKITWDVNTAHRNVSLEPTGGGNDCASFSATTAADVPDHPDRFSDCVQVLSKEPLTGRCYFEVCPTGGCFVGLSYKSLERKGRGSPCVLGLNDKSWACFGSGFKYKGMNNSDTWALCPDVLNRVGVYLNQEAGTLTFFLVRGSSLCDIHVVETQFTEPLYFGALFLYPGDRIWVPDLKDKPVC